MMMVIRKMEDSFHWIDAITVVHLPDGPTAHFKLTSVKLNKEIRVSCTIFQNEALIKGNGFGGIGSWIGWIT